MFKDGFEILMHKSNRDILPVYFKPYFTKYNKLNNHLTRFSDTKYFSQIKLSLRS